MNANRNGIQTEKKYTQFYTSNENPTRCVFSLYLILAMNINDSINLYQNVTVIRF